MCYSHEVPVRSIHTILDVDGIERKIDTSVRLYASGERQLERLEQMMGRRVKMRAKEPYDSGTLEKLARRE